MASRKLSTYRAKRDFSKTAEPSGADDVAPPSKRLRLVIQKHAASRLLCLPTRDGVVHR